MIGHAIPLALLIAAVAAPPARAISWARPVEGAVSRGFEMHGSPYAGGQHRGADFAAARGATVRAPCGGRVVVAARIGTSGGVVTVACGPWRASVLPLARIDVRAGARVGAGEPVGAAGTSALHAGVHLGVRLAGRRFGYVNPLRFLSRVRRPPPAPLGPRGPIPGARRAWPDGPPPAALAPPFRAQRIPAPRLTIPRVTVPRVAARPHLARPAPPVVVRWPAWAGAALLLAGAGGGVVRRRARRRSVAARTGGVRARTRPQTRGA